MIFIHTSFNVKLYKYALCIFRGKGDHYLLGQGTNDHCKVARLISGLRGKKIIDLTCGPDQCLATSDEGEVFMWGEDNTLFMDNEGALMKCKEPMLVTMLNNVHIEGTVFGPNQVTLMCKLRCYIVLMA